MTQNAPSKPLPLGGQTRICKSVIAYNGADLTGHSVWDLTGIQGLFTDSPVVASGPVYAVIARELRVGERVPPEAVAARADLLSTHTAIITQALDEPSGASSAYWPIAAEMLQTFLENDCVVAIIGEGAGFVRLLLAARNGEQLLEFTHLAMTGQALEG